MNAWNVKEGASAPLGATVYSAGVNFSVFSKSATLVELLLFDDKNAAQPAKVIPLDANRHRTSRIINDLVLNAVLAYHQFPYKPFKEVGISYLRYPHFLGQFIHQSEPIEKAKRFWIRAKEKLTDPPPSLGDVW